MKSSDCVTAEQTSHRVGAAADEIHEDVFTVFQLSVMKRCGLILLLLSGYVMVCHLQSDQLVRQLQLVDLQKSWNDAQQYCRDEYVDLAIVNSSALIQEAQKRAGSTEAWIGLFKSGWKWSQTGPVQSSWFNMWSPGQPGTDECVTIFSDGSWSTRPCSATYFFFCYDAATNKHIQVKKSMTWSDAQSYCRQTYTDLSTITDMQDNTQAASVLSLNYQAWIGLYRNWMWSNSSTASNLPWGPGQPDDSLNCVTIVGSTGSFNSHNCGDQRPFLCSRDVKPSASRSVKVQLRAGSADLNDPTVQESILQQVREKLVEQGIREEVKLRWRTQPDGKIFHREEETAPPGYCEEEDCGSV